MTCIMDFPTAWAYIREQHPDPAEHDPRCSWVQAQGGVLCDCHIINDEYERRKAALTPTTCTHCGLPVEVGTRHSPAPFESVVSVLCVIEPNGA